MSNAEEIRKLLLESRGLPDGHEALEVVQEATRLADSLGETYWGLAARAEMMRRARSLLMTRELAAAFTWTLAKFDEDPEAYADFDPIYQFRWVTALLSNFPSITIDKRDDLLAEMSARYEQAGWSQQPIHEVKLSIAEDYADHQMATEARAALLASPGGDEEMEYTLQERELGYWVFMGNDEQALRVGQSFIENPDFESYLNPQMCAQLLLPLLRQGKLDVAESIEPRVRRNTLTRADRVYFWPNGNLLIYWALTAKQFPHRTADAVSLFESFLKVICGFSDPLTQTHFYLDSLPLFNRLAAEDATVSIRLPTVVEIASTGGSCRATDLRQWIIRQAADLTAQFDARNGNDYFRDLLSTRCEL